MLDISNWLKGFRDTWLIGRRIEAIDDCDAERVLGAAAPLAQSCSALDLESVNRFDLDTYLDTDCEKRKAETKDRLSSAGGGQVEDRESEPTFISEFGGVGYSFPSSCTNDYYLSSGVDKCYFGLSLSGDVFHDSVTLINNLRIYSSREGYRREREIIEGELGRALQKVLSDQEVVEPQNLCSPVSAAILRVEKAALMADIVNLKDKIYSLETKIVELTNLNNIYKRGALPARTAHKVSVKAANDVYKAFLTLTRSSLYDGENDFGNSLLRAVFQTKRELALATSEDILSISGVGPATLEKVKAYFDNLNLPCVASFTYSNHHIGLCDWNSVALLSSKAEYQWTLPDFLCGPGKHVVQDSQGYSKLRIT